MPTILLLNGPNLNLLGTREPELYGHESLEEICKKSKQISASFGITLESRQSNHEGVLIDWVHEAQVKGIEAIIINPGGLAHTSISLADALASVAIPYWEVHITNIHGREDFRSSSYLARKARGVICGFGCDGYFHALGAAMKHIANCHSDKHFP